MWNVAAGIIIAGVCFGVLGLGVFLAATPGHPNDEERQQTVKCGFVLIAAGVALGTFVVVKALGYV